MKMNKAVFGKYSQSFAEANPGELQDLKKADCKHLNYHDTLDSVVCDDCGLERTETDAMDLVDAE